MNKAAWNGRCLPSWGPVLPSSLSRCVGVRHLFATTASPVTCALRHSP